LALNKLLSFMPLAFGFFALAFKLPFGVAASHSATLEVPPRALIPADEWPTALVLYWPKAFSPN